MSASTTKMTVILNSVGQVAGASRQGAANAEVTFGQVADLGQTLIEVELPASVAEMDGHTLLSHLAEHALVKSAASRLAASPASTAEISTGTI